MKALPHVGKILATAGVEYVFGLPGGQTRPLYDGIFSRRRIRRRFRWTHVDSARNGGARTNVVAESTARYPVSAAPGTR
jgi:hypothetical protein